MLTPVNNSAAPNNGVSQTGQQRADVVPGSHLQFHDITRELQSLQMEFSWQPAASIDSAPAHMTQARPRAADSPSAPQPIGEPDPAEDVPAPPPEPEQPRESIPPGQTDPISFSVIGHHAVVGSSVWLTQSVPPHMVVSLEKPSLRLKGPATENKGPRFGI
jgi:hypothetical protein